MLLDKQLTMSDQQALAIAAATPTLSTNTIDLRPTQAAGGNSVPGITSVANFTPLVGDIAKGEQVELLCQVTESFTSGGAATLTVEIVSADDAALTSNVTSLTATAALALAALALGKHIPIALPLGITQRYLGMRYTVGTAATTAGKVTAGLVIDRQLNY